MARLVALGLVAPCVWGLRNIFGMGVYNDTPYEPAIAAQLPVVLNLTGTGGWVTLFFEDIDPVAGSAPAAWEMQALADALSMGLVPSVRIGQSARNYRNFSDDAQHVHYTQLAAVYAAYVSALLQGAAALLRRPQTAGSSAAPDVYIQVANEPNICLEWQCDSGPGTYLAWAQVAVEFASFARDVNAALNALPAVWRAGKLERMMPLTFSPMVSPIAQTGPALCECVPGGQGNNTGSVNSTDFITVMLQQVPTLYANVSFHSAHTYPFCQESINDPNGCAMQWMTSYQRERTIITTSREAVGVNGSLPVLIGECGWAGHNDTGKAVWIMEAYTQLWLPDAGVIGVTPYLLAGNFWLWQQQGWPWTAWDNTTLSSITGFSPQYDAVYQLIRGA